ncbi:hypothetical protein KAJ83_01210 [Marivibrio halodurans]|uniref:Uncharacterized protein n=1 Tax=Marivibrio halodurans TaxID=2039722 RepID=A0A8J7RWD2_9PROT|nr:hypothetical protein [Marivibrio halodurans]MBP5855610.1 hypothetical protein [Marivibrio halodurans]
MLKGYLGRSLGKFKRMLAESDVSAGWGQSNSPSDTLESAQAQESMQPSDLVATYRAEISAGRSVPFSDIIALHTRMMEDGAGVPPDLEAHALRQIFDDPSLRAWITPNG